MPQVTLTYDESLTHLTLDAELTPALLDAALLEIKSRFPAAAPLITSVRLRERHLDLNLHGAGVTARAQVSLEADLGG